MSSITRDMLNIPAYMLRDFGTSYYPGDNIAQTQEQVSRIVGNPIGGIRPKAVSTVPPPKTAKELAEEKEKALREAEENKNNPKPKSSAPVRIPIEKANPALAAFDAGFPPKVLPGALGYEEYRKLCQGRTDARNKMVLEEHPEYRLLEPYTVIIDADSPVTDGFIQHLDYHQKVWEEPCLIRLSDIVKKSNKFELQFAEYKQYQEETTQERISCLRHYPLPHTHAEDELCECVFCCACRDTLHALMSRRLQPEHLSFCMIDKIRARTACVVLSQVRMCFQEEETVALDERICYGFRNALPPLVILHFEDLFHEIYLIGAEMCWEILKKLAVLIKYNPDYTSALHFLTFWVDVVDHVGMVVERLEKDMDCFNWKLKQYNLDLKTLFYHFLYDHLYELQEFQNVFNHCKTLVQRQRSYHNLRDYEVDNERLRKGLRRTDSNLQKARDNWFARKLPFAVRMCDVPKYNVFKIGRLRNPYTRLVPNVCEGYEVIRCPFSGQMDFRKIQREVMEECDFANPILDICLHLPKDTSGKFNIRLYRREQTLAPTEVDQFVKNSDLSYLQNYGANVGLKFSGNERIVEYKDKRELSNLDEIEGALDDKIQTVLNAPSRELAKERLRRLKYGEYHRQNKHRRMTTTKPSFPIWGYNKRNKAMVKEFRNILQNNFHIPSVTAKSRIMRHCRKGTKCVRYERVETRRSQYLYGGLPTTKVEPHAGLAEAQTYDLASDLISAAMQLGMGVLDPLRTGSTYGKTYKFFVLYKHVDIPTMGQFVKDKVPRPPQEHTPELYSTLCEAIQVHYSILAKYDIITTEESMFSPHLLERQWAAGDGGKNLTEFKINSQIDTLKRLARPGKMQTAKKSLQDDIMGLGTSLPGTNPAEPAGPLVPIKCDSDFSTDGNVVVAAATQTLKNNEERVVGVTRDGTVFSIDAKNLTTRTDGPNVEVIVPRATSQCIPLQARAVTPQSSSACQPQTSKSVPPQPSKSTPAQTSKSVTPQSSKCVPPQQPIPVLINRSNAVPSQSSNTGPPQSSNTASSQASKSSVPPQHSKAMEVQQTIPVVINRSSTVPPQEPKPVPTQQPKVATAAPSQPKVATTAPSQPKPATSQSKQETPPQFKSASSPQPKPTATQPMPATPPQFKSASPPKQGSASSAAAAPPTPSQPTMAPIPENERNTVYNVKIPERRNSSEDDEGFEVYGQSQLEAYLSQFRCPYGHGDAWMSQCVTSDGTLHLEATLGHVCTHPAHTAGPQTRATITAHAVPVPQTAQTQAQAQTQTQTQTQPPPSARGNRPVQGSDKAAMTVMTKYKQDFKPSRPGLPMSAGFAEKRNTLRQKLEREKKIQEQQCAHEKTGPIDKPDTNKNPDQSQKANPKAAQAQGAAGGSQGQGAKAAAATAATAQQQQQPSKCAKHPNSTRFTTTLKEMTLEQIFEEKKEEIRQSRLNPPPPPQPQPPPDAKVLGKSAKEELEKVEAIANFIEGIDGRSSRKGSLADNEKKAAKKARRRERKEQLRLEEEGQKLAEEEAKRKEEEELLRKEEEEREELAKKKREKKKQKKKKKKEKENDLSQSMTDLLEEVRGSDWTKVEDGKKKKDGDKKGKDDSNKNSKEKENRPASNKGGAQTKGTGSNKGTTQNKGTAPNNKGAAPNKAAVSNKAVPPNKEPAPKKEPTVAPQSQPKVATTTDSNPIVTIRRHSNTPDADVTISVKGDNGKEDLLYTLVRGKGEYQFLRDEIEEKKVYRAGEVPTAEPPMTEAGKKKKKKGKEGQQPPIAENPIIENETLKRILANGVVLSPSTAKAYEEQQAKINSSVFTRQPSQSSITVGKTADRPEINVDNLNIPAGLTITRLPEPAASYGPRGEGRLWDKGTGSANPPTGQPSYENNQNLFLDSSNFNAAGDFNYGQQSMFYHGKEASGEFEEVLSSKKRRQRNRANKQKDGEDEPEISQQPRNSNGSLEFKMMELSLNNSVPTNPQPTVHLKRNAEEQSIEIIPSPPTNSSGKRNCSVISKPEERPTQLPQMGQHHTNMNGISSSLVGSSFKIPQQQQQQGIGREIPPPNTDFTHFDGTYGGKGKPTRGGMTNMTTIPRLNRQARPQFGGIGVQPSLISQIQNQTQRPTNNWNSAAEPHMFSNANTNHFQDPRFNDSMRRLSDMGYVQSATIPNHYEKTEHTSSSHENGSWHPGHPLSAFNSDGHGRQLSYRTVGTPPPAYHAAIGSNHHPFQHGSSDFLAFQKMQQYQNHIAKQQQQQRQQQTPFQFSSSVGSGFSAPNFNFGPHQHRGSSQGLGIGTFDDYNNQKYQQAQHSHPHFESQFNHGMDPGFFQSRPPNASSPHNARPIELPIPTSRPVEREPLIQQPQSTAFTVNIPWRKTSTPTPTAVGDTFASVLKRDGDGAAKETSFGSFGDRRERENVSPWTWGGGDSDKSESGSGGARPSPEVFFHSNITVGAPAGSSGSGIRNQYNDDNSYSRAQSCDSALVGGSNAVPIGRSSPFSNPSQVTIRRPTPTSPFMFGFGLSTEQNRVQSTERNISASPDITATRSGSGIPEWGDSPPKLKLGTFWSSHE